MKKALKQLISDNEGHPSSLRIVFLLTGLTFIPAFVTVWIYVSIHTQVVADVPGGVYDLLGVLLVGKSLQKGVEVWGEKSKISLDSDTSK